MRLIAGFEYPDSGVIELDGEDVAGLPPNARDVNTVFQDYALFPHMTVRQNIAYGLEVRKTPKSEIGGRVEDALAMVRLQDFGDRRPGQLSGGQRQRVALARAIVNRPRVLLLDEPLGALDLKLRQEMQVELKSIQQSVGITFLYVTHDQEEALSMSDRIAVFNQGGIEQIGTPTEVYERPATAFVAGFVGTSNMLEREGRRIALRPEKIRLYDLNGIPPEDCQHREPGTVVETIYGGMFTRFLVELADTTIVQVVQQNALRLIDGVGLKRGDRVGVAWRQDSLFEIAPKP